MRLFNRLTAAVMAAALLGPMAPLEAKTRKGDKFLVEGRVYETKRDWDAALASYEKALSEDPAEILYRMAVDKTRFQAAQAHVDNGIRIRSEGKLGEAMIEFQKAWAINSGSAVAQQEIARTQEMIIRERRRVEETGKASPPEERATTPAERARKETQERINRILPVPELQPANPDAIPKLKINGQPAKTIFDTIGKVAEITVLWDPEYNAPTKPINVDFTGSTLEQALDYVAVITKSYWKALSPTAIFVTNDNPNKRRDYAEMVAKTFYLSNIQTPQEIQEIVNAIRSVSELQRVVPYNSQNAIIVRGEADQVALAEKMIQDLDKPKAEVVVDIMVMEASSVFSRQLTTAIASSGLSIPIAFSPRDSITVTSGSGTSASKLLPLSNIHLVNDQDFALTLPSATLTAILSDTKTKVLQSPQLRSVDGGKATLKIGERQPTATASNTLGLSAGVSSALLQTSFTFIDVGVNVEITPRVHENGDVSMHVDLDISAVSGYVDLGGIKQPIIGQRKVQHDIRMHEGEVNLLGGLTKSQESKQFSGIPGLSSIPLIGRLFSGESVDRQSGDLMIVLVPHIVRRPDFNANNLRSIAVGNATSVKLSYAPPPKSQSPAPATPQTPAAAATQPAAPVAQPAPVAPSQAAAAPPEPNQPAMPAAGAPPATAPPATPPPPTTARQAVPEPTGSAQIRVNPGQVNTSASGSFTVTIGIEGAVDMVSAPIQVQFDPKMVRLNDAVRGDFLSSDGQPALFTKNILNDAGTATLDLTRLPRAAGVSGSGPLITLQFQALGRGNSVITIPNLTVRNSQGQAIATATSQVAVTTR
jgi:general secretion pathway protein D